MRMSLLLRTINRQTRRSVTYSLCTETSLHPAIPRSVTKPNYKLSDKSNNKKVIDPATIEHLERISLVDFANVAGIKRLEDAVQLAEVVTRVDTTGVEPLYSVLEGETLRLREDVVEPPDNRSQLMSLASISEEDYFVAPQGNVPLSYQNKYSEPAQDSTDG